MRKRAPLLSLNRETLRRLDSTVQGGVRAGQNDTDGDSCVLSCTPTCHDCDAAAINNFGGLGGSL